MIAGGVYDLGLVCDCVCMCVDGGWKGLEWQGLEWLDGLKGLEGLLAWCGKHEGGTRAGQRTKDKGQRAKGEG